ncbi:3-hydroxyacyl-ACP dehydratase [Dyadobacter sp. CY107]|uniref:3-hydroxyacyl-ACP dehydratase n=1 Tax=Dyadobacter fanqingshengii TaxID=2906443 RepID=UPI001F3EC918|nr:3-hydroxyacyl-ACP dehydratase [Dyadobacter fanqingshengii]MCF2505133.1 3-hydroxyacyl-ACP dehydratase [Dyadobacter fanqingshengii]
MFVNSLYFITSNELTPENIVSGIKINEQHAVFEGHFPNSPVLPGVVQLQIVKEILETHLERKLAMKTMRTCKFLEVLNPGKNQNVRILIKYKQSEMLEVTASGEDNGKVFFKMQANYL